MDILLLAQASAQGGNPILGYMPIIIMVIIFWVTIIVPQRRQAKAHQAMIAALQRGDQVVTAGGVIGEITSVKDDQVQLKSGQSTLVVERAKIARRIGPLPVGVEKK